MNICILALANPITWTAHYVKAFREFGDVVTVGPDFDRGFLVTCGLADRPDLIRRNDIRVDLTQTTRLVDELPAGWVPDLIVAISDFGRALRPDMTGLSCPKVYLSIDTWQSPVDYMDALHYDFVFAAQKSFVPRIRATGSRQVSWLPLGCDPELHAPCADEPVCDVSFAGSLVAGVHDERIRHLEAVAARYEVGAYKGVHDRDYAQAICSGKLTFNHSAVNDLNMRIFEALAMGVPLLTNRGAEMNGLLELFEEGKQLLVYDSPEHLLKLVDGYVGDVAAREALSEGARRLVLEKHTYRHRVETILATVAAGLSSPVPPEGDGVSENLILCHIPCTASSLLDVGGDFGEFRDDFSRRGVKEFIGIGEKELCVDGGAFQQMTWPLEARWTDHFDGVVLGDLNSAPAPLGEVMDEAHRLLQTGGTLLMALTPGDLQSIGLGDDAAKLVDWFRARNFNLFEMVQEQSDGPAACEIYVIRAVKRERTLRSVVSEGLAEIPIEYDSPMEFLKNWPEDM